MKNPYIHEKGMGNEEELEPRRKPGRVRENEMKGRPSHLSLRTFFKERENQKKAKGGQY